MRTLRFGAAVAVAAPWVTPKATIPLMPGAELWEDFCVPSDYNTFNKDVFLPVATGGQK